MKKLGTGVAVLIFTLCLVWYVRQTILLEIPWLVKSSDFELYVQAAQQVMAGRSPYSSIGYIYPPLLALLLTPLAPLTYESARWTWFIFSQVCLVSSAWLIWRASGRDWPAACAIAFVWAFGGSAQEALGLGQLGPQLALALALSYTQKGAWRGAAAGFGAALKLIPGILGVVWLIRKDWRAVAVLAVTSFVLLAAPWAFVAFCLAGPKSPAGANTWTGTPALLSWSLPSVVLRALDPPRGIGPLPHNWEAGNDLPNLKLPTSHRRLSIATAFSTILVGCAVLWFSLKDRHSINTSLAMAGVLALGLAASPVAWSHYQVMQYPGVAILLAHAWRLRLWMVFAVAIVCAALLYPMPQYFLSLEFHKLGKWTSGSPATLYFWTSITPFAELLLFGLFVREARRTA